VEAHEHFKPDTPLAGRQVKSMPTLLDCSLMQLEVYHNVIV